MSLLADDSALAGLSASVAVDASGLEPGPRLILSVHLIAVCLGILLNGFVLAKLQGYAVGAGREDKLAFRLLIGLVLLFQLLQYVHAACLRLTASASAFPSPACKCRATQRLAMELTLQLRRSLRHVRRVHCPALAFGDASVLLSCSQLTSQWASARPVRIVLLTDAAGSAVAALIQCFFAYRLRLVVRRCPC